MNINIIAGTVENPAGNIQDNFKLLAGKTAGVCYMPDNYLSQGIQDKEKAFKRAENTAKSGHHSVYDHAHITLSITGIPKILAMLLNSTNDYVTSEKSARYTEMKPETQLETDLYNKWLSIIAKRIDEVYPKISVADNLKLAQENARYLLSVFTPTTMVYTTSHRQLSYIYGWLAELSVSLADNPNSFNNKLNQAVKEFYSQLSDIITPAFVDTKGREFDFIPQQYGHKKILPVNYIGNTYTQTYVASLAYLAQAQRHRTLNYTMWFRGDNAGEYGYYVPPIISETEFEDEWLEDCEKLNGIFPQGTLVLITEEGLTKHFFLKCKERLCGRAQLEIAQKTSQLLELFIDRMFDMDWRNQALLSVVAPNNKPTAKCGMEGFECKEVCRWGVKNWYSRKI